MTNQPEAPDPFAGGIKLPSVSFDKAPIGTTYVGVVTAAPTLAQSRDFDTDKPAFWEDGNPKMAAVFHMRVDGEEKAVWAGKPSALFAAVAEAQVAAGRMAIGDTVAIRLIGEKPNDNPKKHAQKLYAVRITKPDAFAAGPPATPAPAMPATPPPAAAPADPWANQAPPAAAPSDPWGSSTDEPPF